MCFCYGPTLIIAFIGWYVSVETISRDISLPSTFTSLYVVTLQPLLPAWTTTCWPGASVASGMYCVVYGIDDVTTGDKSTSYSIVSLIP